MKTFDSCTLYQGFAENANGAYKLYKGHPGIDSGCGYGTDIFSPVTGVVTAIYTPEKPAKDGYVAIYILTETKLEKFEYNVGHCSKVFVKLGDTVTKGQLIAQEGNKGLVYQGDVQITLAMQKAGDKRGSHRHNQKRPVREVPKRVINGDYLQNAKGYVRSPSGGYYEYALSYKDYAACVDFTKPLFDRTLQNGSEGYDVILLQRAIGMPSEMQTGFFGKVTENFLIQFQATNGLDAVGICGPKTRTFLNARYGQLEDPARVVPTRESALQDLKEAVDAVVQATATSTRPTVQSRWDQILETIKGLWK